MTADKKIFAERIAAEISPRPLPLVRAARWMLLALLFVSACDTLPDQTSVPDPDAVADPPPRPPLIAIYGDSRTGHDVHRLIVAAMERLKPEAVFHSGDLVANGLKPGQWNTFNAITARLRQSSEFYPALGNHELDSPLYFANFILPGNERWYWVEIDGIHFVVLDTGSDLGAGSEQYRWLEELLSGIAPADFVVPVFHHPPLSAGYHLPDEKGLLRTIVPLFEKYDVDLVFSGHDHTYERLFYNGIQYIVTGGGGAPLHSQARTSPYLQLYLEAYHFCTLRRQGGSLKIEVFGTDSRLLDSFRVER